DAPRALELRREDREMIERDLQSVLAAHYEGESLSADALERLLVAAERSAARGRNVRPRFRAVLAAAASLLLAALALSLVAPRLVERDPARVTRAVAAEILDHERAGMPVQFSAESAQKLRAEMTRLDFRIEEPRRIAREGATLVGARYCT